MPRANKVGRAAGALFSALVLLGLSSCGSGTAETQALPSGVEPGSSVGSALTPTGHFYAKAGAMPPGARVGVMLLFLSNQSDEAVTLETVLFPQLSVPRTIRQHGSEES